MKVVRKTKLRESGNVLRSKDGFTLIEVAVAVTVLTIVFVGAFGALVAAHGLIETSRDQTRAAQILQSEFEEVRTMSWTGIYALPATATYSPSADFVNAFGDRYSITRRITTKHADQKEISVIVSWTGGNGTTKNLEYITWYTKDGFSDYYFRKI